MDNKRPLITMAILVALALSSIPFASASVSNTYGNIPKIDQWTNAAFPTGTSYTNVTRINGVWYFDGQTYPAASDKTTSNLGPNTTPTDPNTTPAPNPNITPNSTPQPDTSPTGQPTPAGTIPEGSATVFILVAVFAVIILATAGVATKQSKTKKQKTTWKYY